MVHFASPAEVATAAQLVNSALATARVATGCKIELGLALLLTGLSELSGSCRAHVLGNLLTRLTGHCREFSTSPADPDECAGHVCASGVMLRRSLPASERLH